MKWLLRKKKKHEMSTVGYLTQGIGGTDTHLHAPQPEAWLIRKQAPEDTVYWSLVSYIMSSCWPLIIVMAIVFPALCQTPIIFARYLSKHIWRPCNHELALYFLMGKPLFSINRKPVRLLWVCFHWLCWTFLSNGLWLHNPCCKNANVVEMNCL